MMMKPPSFRAVFSAHPIIDPLVSYTKTQRIFVWTILYLAEKPTIINVLRNKYNTVSSLSDICIRTLIDFLDSENNNAENAKALYESQGPLKMYWEQAWDELCTTLKTMLDNGIITSISGEHTEQVGPF